VDSDALVTVALAGDERNVLRCGLVEWDSPVGGTDALAVAMGFRDMTDLLEQGRRLRLALVGREPLTAKDWRKMLAATEIMFASDVFGSGPRWSSTTGFSDEETIRILRSLQKKIARALRNS
jgi:hypothetical protein